MIQHGGASGILAKFAGRILPRFRRDKQGAAAIEFAVLLPLMLTLNMGLVDVTSGVRLDRKVSLLSRTLADLASQFQTAAPTDISAIFDAASAVLSPNPASAAKMRITSVIMKTNGTNCVDWSYGKNAAPKTRGSAITLSSPLLDPGATTWQSVILAEIEYPYVPVTQYVIGNLTLGEKTLMRPRASTRVQLLWGASPPANPNNPCGDASLT